ncbi:O-antigen ligase family protein [Novosphingobium resinovorum]|uniref:O-antigen ligase family protein n=1 Tax=Novosphingobium resinovorum TaxID=158500 RepID=UPI002ED54ACD|nr:O-antigen ligase family protein [Novosphingobium resinovorum]
MEELLSDRTVQDGAFAGLIVLSRIPANLGTAGAGLGLGLMCVYAALRMDQCRAVLRRCWPQFAYPAAALLSIAWAVYPIVTARAAVQMAMTAFAGLLVSQAIRPRAVIAGLFVAFAGYTLASLFAGHSRPDGISGAPALFGLGGEAKNYFADSAATAALLAVTIGAIFLERLAFVRAGISAGIAILCVIATERARSAGALASLGLAGSLLLACLALRGRSPATKLGFAVFAVAGLCLCAVFAQPLLALVQELSGKDAGLTGRGYLWYRADFIIAERPWLGTGYFGFWTPANPDAIGFWRYFDVRQEGTAFSFHNSYIQTLVETGYLGLAVLAASWIVGALAMLRRFVLTPSVPTCFWLAYLVLELSKSPVEPIRPAALVAPTIMLFAALGFGNFPVLRPSRSG